MNGINKMNFLNMLAWFASSTTLTLELDNFVINSDFFPDVYIKDLWNLNLVLN